MHPETKNRYGKERIIKNIEAIPRWCPLKNAPKKKVLKNDG